MSDEPTGSTWDPSAAPEPEEEPGLIAGFWQFLWQNWPWWVVPTVLIFVLLIVIVWMAQDSTVAPFIYALF